MSGADAGAGSEPDSGKGQQHPGQRLGLPAEGPGSVATLGRRVLALVVDWGVCVLVVAAFGLDPLYGPPSDSLLALLVLVVERTLLVGLLGFSIGHRFVGLRVARLDGRPVGLPAAFARSALTVLLIPPLVLDPDSRGLHDRLAGTVVLRR